MSNIIEFIKPNDLIVIEGENEFVIRKGFLHINEIIIDKNGSSNSFIKAMREFIQNKKIDLSQNDSAYEDFMQLTKFGLIDIAMNKNFLLIINKNYKDMVNNLCPDSIQVKTIEEMLSNEDIKTLTENKNVLKLNELYDKFSSKLKNYDHIYYLNQFCNLVTNRAFNRIINKLDIEYTIGIFDNDNIYLTGIKPNYTGCYECLEKHIISKFSGTIKQYEDQYNNSLEAISDNADISLVIGMVLKDMSNINKYGASSLTGNVIHFYTPNFEYSYNVNRKNSSCSVCATVNNVKFEEQNIRSVNVIKEVLSK
ncbi:bacteriocin biosynthesis cyclodehydratase [Clostridium sp. MSJ-8]|uniref:bacteriocin biosynthesis cyclodehydratase n=1 Tax=Clostridium sp. MSJ-8 TaxID=2841510 RepID=UPI001C0EF762|nr:bacteriocin biosynthesis cyclodehydratase [Clostridium sp. MSJ-8]MBU5487320.1 bacteriocin biosynthesis cyclodehydratase [Clostridium sp. MSJ-8]